MKTTSKYIHKAIKYFGIESLFIKLSVYNIFFQKFIPLHIDYSKTCIKKVKRDNYLFYLEENGNVKSEIKWRNIENFNSQINMLLIPKDLNFEN